MTGNDISIMRDEEGYLVNPEEWTPEIASALALEEELELGDEHWTVLMFMREYYADHGITPDIRHVAKHLASHIGTDKKTAKPKLFALFPFGYVKQACKIAGMKRPRAWSTG